MPHPVRSQAPSIVPTGPDIKYGKDEGAQFLPRDVSACLIKMCAEKLLFQSDVVSSVGVLYTSSYVVHQEKLNNALNTGLQNGRKSMALPDGWPVGLALSF